VEGLMRLPPGAAPVSLAQDGPDVLLIQWSHGHRGRHRVRDLRLACRCAECVDEWTGSQRLAPDAVPADVRPVRIEPVGLYGLSIEWSDGHSTGIYTFETLAELCQCEQCLAAGSPRTGSPPSGAPA
jgi:ATP-binding protein involved in chromosome partitioning